MQGKVYSTMHLKVVIIMKVFSQEEYFFIYFNHKSDRVYQLFFESLLDLRERNTVGTEWRKEDTEIPSERGNWPQTKVQVKRFYICASNSLLGTMLTMQPHD